MKRKMLQFSPDLSAYLEERINKYGYQATKQEMFGHQVFFLNGYMFSGANVDGIFVHTGKEERDQALENEPDVGQFVPMEGMIMREYLLLKKPLYSDEKKLKKWLDKSSEYLRSLPPKKKKSKKN
jgi:TfoX/Sxy family transcriptional regulator of competence genes